jgi:hypothetical protein
MVAPEANPIPLRLMASSDVFIRAFEAVQQRFNLTLDGITPEQLTYRPHAEANSIAWLAWHLTRWQDAQIARFSEQDQVWVCGWAEKFARSADPQDTGIGHTSEDVGSLMASGPLLIDYHGAVLDRTLGYLRKASEADLEREYHDAARNRTDMVSARLVGVLSDNFQHVGQMAYLRGLLAGAHWGAH